jgi:hypothetical protein
MPAKTTGGKTSKKNKRSDVKKTIDQELSVTSIKKKSRLVKKSANVSNISKKCSLDSAETNIHSDFFIAVDFPKENEKFNKGHYSLRVSAKGNGRVEVSFDGDDWVSCRHASGFWWFDWTNFDSGKYAVLARLIDNSGNVVIQTKNKRNFRVL